MSWVCRGIECNMLPLLPRGFNLNYFRVLKTENSQLSFYNQQKGPHYHQKNHATGKYFVDDKHLKPRTALHAFIKAQLSLIMSAMHHRQAVLLTPQLEFSLPSTTSELQLCFSYYILEIRTSVYFTSLTVLTAWKLRYKPQKGKRKEDDRQGIKLTNKFSFILTGCQFLHLLTPAEWSEYPTAWNYTIMPQLEHVRFIVS